MTPTTNEYEHDLKHQIKKPLVSWDDADPVANAIIDLVEAQQSLQTLFNAYSYEDNLNKLDTAIDAAVQARNAAVAALASAELAYWRDGVSAAPRRPDQPRKLRSLL